MLKSKRVMGCLAVLLAAAFAVSAGAAEKLKIGMYADYGVRGGGVMGWVKILINCPQAELTLLDADDIRAGKLSQFDVFLLPGGQTGDQNRTLGAEGKEAIRKYVADGGKYLGTCAGCGSAMNIGIGIGLVNCGNYQNTDRGQAILPVRITPEGAEMLGIKPGVYNIQYAGGPIPDFSRGAKEWEGKHVVLAKYESTLGKIMYSKKGKRAAAAQKAAGPYKHPPMYGWPAMVFATYGKGKVLVSGPHPEKHDSTVSIALGQIYALTGVKCTYVAPKLGRRPIRVAFHSGAITGKDCFRGLIDLYQSPELDVYPGADFGSAGSLDHADVLVLPDGSSRNYGRRFNPKDRYVRRFLDRGGLVIAFGEGRKYLPVHRNCRSVDNWQELKPAILAYFK